jgi:hypothetical protein
MSSRATHFNGHPGVALHGEFNAFEPAPMPQEEPMSDFVGTPRCLDRWSHRPPSQCPADGGGVDSHNVFHRYFGLNDSQTNELVGSRLQDTDFAQFGGHSKLSFHRPPTKA